MIRVVESEFGKIKVYSADLGHGGAYVLVVPGYSEGITHVKKLVEALGEEGFRAFSFSQPRKSGATRGPDPILRQSRVIDLVLREMVPSGSKVVGVAHSLGAAVVLKVAQAEPERFSELILMQPVGLVGKQSVPELFYGVNKKAVKDYLHARRGDHGSSIRHVAVSHVTSLGSLLTHPLLTLREARSAGAYGGTDLAIKRLKDVGIPLHVVVSENDELFDKDKMSASADVISAHAASYTKLRESHRGHDTFWIHPLATAELICKIIKK